MRTRPAAPPRRRSDEPPCTTPPRKRKLSPWPLLPLALSLLCTISNAAPAAARINASTATDAHSAASPSAAKITRPAPKTPAPKSPAPTGAPLCESKNITVELPREFLQLAVVNNSFIARNNSLSVIAFQSFFSQPIEEIAIVAENEDDSGKLIFSNVYAASAASTLSPSWFSTYLPSYYDIASWPKPVAPRTTFTLSAASGITTPVCPAQIKATVVHLQFAGGQQINYSTPGWQLPAQPQAIPGALEFYAPPRDLPEEFTVQVHQPAPLGPIIPPPIVTLVKGKQGLLFDRIRDQMQEWRFAFAIRNGESVDGDETLLIRLHSQKEKITAKSFWISPAEISGPTGIVDLIPLKIPEKWGVFYGGVDLSGVSPAQIQ